MRRYNEMAVGALRKYIEMAVGALKGQRCMCAHT
jgi:hypothetical protein